MTDNSQNQDFGSRLTKLMQDKKLERTELSNLTGINYEMIRRYMVGLAQPRPDKMQKLAEALGVSMAFLSYGKEQMIFEAVRKIRNVPVLSWVRAGLFHETGELQYDETEPVYDEDYPEGIYWLTVKGDSMEPRFHEGDLILIDPNRTAKAGDYVIAIRLDAEGSYENAMTFKKYRQGFDEKIGRDYSQLVPLNEDYAVIDSRHTPFEVRGVVLERKEKFV